MNDIDSYNMDEPEKPASNKQFKPARSKVLGVMGMHEDSPDEGENVISVDSGEKTYRFRLSME